MTKILSSLYDNRFSSYERVRKVNLWKVLIDDFLQQFITKEDVVVDIGAGSCEFINLIKAKHKIAFDLNPKIYDFAQNDVEIISAPISKISKFFQKRKVNVAFLSNVVEHIDTKEEAFNLLLDIYKILVRGGKLLIMQPDIKRVGNAYWDFFDHKIAITESSLLEVLNTVGFRIKMIKSPFLPYSTKIRFLPLSPILLRIYLKIRPLHILFGKQFFVCAQKV